MDRFNDTMGMFASALLVDCVGCHSSDITFDTAAFAVPTPRIQRARQMVVMMNTINRTYFGGEQRVTCFTCHNGDTQPAQAPSLRLQYSELVTDPSPLRFFASVGAPPADTILARYLQALGGAEQLAAITSLAATGTYSGFDTLTREVPMELLARAPDQRAMVARGETIGTTDFFWTYDGSTLEVSAGHPLAADRADRIELGWRRHRRDGVFSRADSTGVRAVAGELR